MTKEWIAYHLFCLDLVAGANQSLHINEDMSEYELIRCIQQCDLKYFFLCYINTVCIDVT